MITKSSINTSSFMYKLDTDGKWVAAHPYLGLITVSTTKQKARQDMIDVVLAHTQFAVENDNWQYLYRPMEKSELDQFKPWDDI